MLYYDLNIDDLYEKLGSSENGLTSEEANIRLIKNGKNKLDEHKKQSIFVKFFDKLKDPMIIILIIAAIISAIVSIINKEPLTDVFIILFVVILNAVLGVIQETKAEEAIESLKELTKSHAKVLRDNQIVNINSENIVIGDVIILEAGDQVPADSRIIEAISLQVEEASLTGESVPVNKINKVLKIVNGEEIALADRENMVYMGTTIAYGRGKAIVCQTGMNTEMGKIAKAITDVTEEKTPLQIKLAELSKMMSIAVIGICILIFIMSIIKAGSFDFKEVILPSFMVAISLAVAAIPEGLAAVVTIVLSIGVTKMSKEKAVIRKLTAVETLGCTQIICSDKTGTLTQNKMTVVEFFTNDLPLLCKSLTLCSDAYLENNQAVGEPTECALVNFAYKEGFDKTNLELENKRTNELPFDSTRKLMTTIHGNIQYTKGAPDELLKRCTYYLDENKNVVPLTSEQKQIILAKNKEFADKALRVLASSYKNIDELPKEFTSNNIENDLIFIGLVGMIDPIRPEVKLAIEQCNNAGIRTVMITGDNKDTAVAIGKELQIINSDTEALSGNDLDKMSDEELANNIDKYFVFARVKPEHKVRIVKAWKNNNKIVAMTGDGVNDAPSIKSADIGIGMGITGTDVTKNVADMVLSDDNFATIVNAVYEGRIIYNNIKKSIYFLLSSNLAEVITILIATMFGFVILKAPHLLWINLITDCFPALSLGVDPPNDDIMKEAPRDKNENLFSKSTWFNICFNGVMVAVLTLLAYHFGKTFLYNPKYGSSEMQGMTMAFLTMSMAEIFHSFNMRSFNNSIFKIKKQNWFLIASMGISFILTFIVIEITPIANLFSFSKLGLKEYLVAISLALLVIPIVEIVKIIKKFI